MKYFLHAFNVLSYLVSIVTLEHRYHYYFLLSELRHSGTRVSITILNECIRFLSNPRREAKVNDYSKPRLRGQPGPFE